MQTTRSLNTQKAITPAAYAAIIAGAYVVMPSNSDLINAPIDLGHRL
ncbi:MAG TPA: hypothetical protein VJ695_09410 [Nitrososphaera sp.]|nr:hypothetical protein [Nitrososphaera sp.]